VGDVTRLPSFAKIVRVEVEIRANHWDESELGMIEIASGVKSRPARLSASHPPIGHVTTVQGSNRQPFVELILCVK
jgi:hypothetical protein